MNWILVVLVIVALVLAFSWRPQCKPTVMLEEESECVPIEENGKCVLYRGGGDCCRGKGNMVPNPMGSKQRQRQKQNYIITKCATPAEEVGGCSGKKNRVHVQKRPQKNREC